MRKINIVTLGCPKNIVDSEKLATFLNLHGYQIVFDGQPNSSPIVIINTCGFINDSKKESIETIFDFVEAKKQGIVEKIIVFGCLTQLYEKEIKKEIPEIDYVFGVNSNEKILKTLNLNNLTNPDYRIISTPNHYAFLKIAEGCNRKCSFCTIPIIRGQYVSYPIENLTKEAKNLAEKGVKELILVSQDSSYYGYDIYKKFALIDLLKELSKIDKLQWIRLHYLYPTKDIFTLVDYIAQNPKICKYFDIPFQHVSDEVLASMKRGHTKNDIIKIIDYIRTTIPDATIRSSFIVGYPTETDKDYDELTHFVSMQKLDRVGVFIYSHEEKASAFSIGDKVPKKIKKDRYRSLMELQSLISLEKNRQKIGINTEVIIDRFENNVFYGRTQGDSPEIDNEVIITNNKKLKIGQFYNVKIYDATEYDLYGEIEK